jgi:hypothetical protein
MIKILFLSTILNFIQSNDKPLSSVVCWEGRLLEMNYKLKIDSNYIYVNVNDLETIKYKIFKKNGNLIFRYNNENLKINISVNDLKISYLKNIEYRENVVFIVLIDFEKCNCPR